MEEHNLTSAGFCNVYNDDNNSTWESLSNLVTSHHWADGLRGIRIGNWNKLIIAQININSVRNKFELLSINVKGNIHILLKTQIDQSFCGSQFLIEGYLQPF